MKKRKLSSLAISILLALFFISCEDNKSTEGENGNGNDNTKTKYDICIAGYGIKANEDYMSAKYWKNGEEEIVTSGDPSREIHSIVVAENGDIHTCGGMNYWINGQKVSDIDGMFYVLNAVGNDIYLGGYGYSDGKATYWKNGVPVNMSYETQEFSEIAGIAVDGGDVYTCGVEYNVAKYWKNGTPYKLSQNAWYGRANDIAVSGNDVHIAWSGTYTDIKKTYTAVYTKNGVHTILAENTCPSGVYEDVSANAIVLSGTDVYIAGHISSSEGKKIAVYWKNGSAIHLTDGSNHAEAKGIAVINNDIYVVGYAQGKDGARSAVYWKNGEEVILSEENEYAEAASIFIVTQK